MKTTCTIVLEGIEKKKVILEVIFFFSRQPAHYKITITGKIVIGL